MRGKQIRKPRCHHLLVSALGLALGTLTGCQTWVGGQTLPSGRYLEHMPQYIPDSPPFPLSKELAMQEATAAAPAGGGGVAPGAGLPPGR